MPVRRIKASWWVDFRHAGTRYRKRSPHNSKLSAQEYEALLRQQLARGGPLAAAPTTGTTFAAFATRWFDTYVRVNNKASEQRTKNITLRAHLVPWFGRMLLSHIRPPDIEAYKAAKLTLKLSAKSINNHLAILAKCLRTAVDWDIINAIPRFKLLRTAPPPFDFLTPKESRALLQDAEEPMWNMMARVALRTGMRRGELFALDWSDIDLERGLITVRRSTCRGIVDTPKSNRIRHIPMSSDLQNLLSAQPQQEGLVFQRAGGAPVTDWTATDAIRRICKRTGIRPIGWHALRHTFCSQLVSEGISLTAVKELLGHSSIIMTMRYAHLAPSTLQSAVAVLERAEARAMSEDIGQPMGNPGSLATREHVAEAA